MCGVHLSEQRISKRGYCYEHGLALRLANIAQLERKSGPHYDHWEARYILAARRMLIARQARLDNAQTTG